MSTVFLNFPSPRFDSITGEKYYTSEDAMNLTPQQYEEWIYSNKTKHVDEVRLYKSKFWNLLLTKSPPFLPLLFWPFIISYLIFYTTNAIAMLIIVVTSVNS